MDSPRKNVSLASGRVNLLIDLSRMHFCMREAGPAITIDYVKMAKAVISRTDASDLDVYLFSALDPSNQKQADFIAGLKRDLGATAITVPPHQSTPVARTNDKAVLSLINFSPEIAAAATRLAIDGQAVVVASDAYGLSGVMIDLAQRSPSLVAMCFMREWLDQRWFPVFEEHTRLRFINLADTPACVVRGRSRPASREMSKFP